jgi:hypothetical protein
MAISAASILAFQSSALAQPHNPLDPAEDEPGPSGHGPQDRSQIGNMNKAHAHPAITKSDAQSFNDSSALKVNCNVSDLWMQKDRPKAVLSDGRSAGRSGYAKRRCVLLASPICHEAF